MRKCLVLAVTLLFLAPAAFADIVEGWTGVQPGTNTGTFADTNGSKVEVTVDQGPKAGQKALKVTSNLVQGGFCGVWHNFMADMSKAGELRFMAKSTLPGTIQVALKDAYNVQYISSAQVGKDWAEVSIPLISFRKDPYYTPPDATLGHPMDLSKTSGMNFAPQMVGAAVLFFGPVEAGGKSAPAPGAAAPTETKDIRFIVSPGKVLGAISPYVYGLNSQNPEGLNPTVRRLGGNRMTGYNWTNNDSSAGTDWQNFSDDYLCVSAKLADCNKPGAVYRHFVEENRKAGLDSLVTIQMAGYVAADKKGEVKKGETAPSPRWAKVEFEKKGPFTLSPKPDSKVVYDDEFVHFLVHRFQPASKGGIKFYDLDNEPALWPSKHPRIHPDKVTYAEMVERTDRLSNAILKQDPSAMIFGPVAYGWQAFLTLQEAEGYQALNKTYGTFFDYYLQQLRDLEKKEGKRLVHVLDLHWYPEAQGSGIRITENDLTPDSVDARVQAPRSLWDPAYVEKSWITKYSTKGKPIRLIPWLQEMIAKDYPGTKLSFTEYDYGGGNHVSGGIAQADVLGIFGKYGVYMSNYWGDMNAYNQAAFKLYRNYDGHDGTFGGTSVSAETGDEALASVYAATDPAKPGTLWVVVLNKSQKAALRGNFKLQGKDSYKSYVSYGFDAQSSDIKKLKEGGIDGDHFDYSLAPLSATLFVCQGGDSSPTK